MKRLTILLFTYLCMLITIQAQNNIGINDDNSSAKASAMLDIYSTTKGLLIPRIVLTATTTAAPATTPETSLLIYNTATAGDVSPGYYYWNASKWVRLLADADAVKNLTLVTKTADATLLKTETMVVASGDITLTLPVVTSADDGLEITVKNIGTYTDLITVVPEATKKIDVESNSLLTRWRGRTFVASGSNWVVKVKETHTDNQYDICTSGSFTTIAEVVAFLNQHMTGPTVIRLGGGVYPISSTITINRSFPVTFQGLSYDETTISAAAGVSGNPLFSCATECSFKMISFTSAYNAAGNDAIRFTASLKYHEVKDCTFTGFNKGIVSTNNNDLWIFENDFENCSAAGIEIAAGAASGGRIRMSETDFLNCKTGVNLLSGVAYIVSITNCVFYNTTAGIDIGILYTPATFTSFVSMFITNTSWNNQGTYMSGFDFTRADGRDANSFIQNNSGMEDKRPNCKINVRNNSATTTITNSGTYYKANWTNTSLTTCKFAVLDNKVTYQPVNRMDLYMTISGNLSVNAASRTISFGVCKNGNSNVRWGESTMITPTKTVDDSYQFSTVVFLSNVSPADYFEFFVNSSSNGDKITVQNINWFVNSQ